VKGVENMNKFGTKSESYSNSVCYYFKPKIFIPNSFTPNGKNPIFLPIINFSQIDTYDFTIFNRWGQPVFRTSDTNEGWNGINGTEECPNGLYVYQLKINDSSDKEIIKRGLINLIR
jgi:gliding motility-associated-like protein